MVVVTKPLSKAAATKMTPVRQMAIKSPTVQRAIGGISKPKQPGTKTIGTGAKLTGTKTIGTGARFTGTKSGAKKPMPGFTPKTGDRPTGPMPSKPGSDRWSVGRNSQIEQFRKLRTGKSRTSAMLPGRRGRGKKVIGPGTRKQWQQQ